jgi:hypothetical protein
VTARVNRTIEKDQTGKQDNAGLCTADLFIFRCDDKGVGVGLITFEEVVNDDER